MTTRETVLRVPIKGPLLALAFAVSCVVVGYGLGALGAMSPRLQLAIAGGLIVVPATFALYSVKPHLVIDTYVFVIPFLIGVQIAGPVRLSEVTSLIVLMVAAPALVLSPQRVSPAVKRLSWPLVALSLLGIVSSLANSISTPDDLANAVFKYASFALMLRIIYIVNDTEHKVAVLRRALVVSAGLIAVYSLAAYFLGFSYYEQYGYSRVSGTFEHWNELGGYMALTLFPTLLFGWASQKRGIRLLALAAAALELVALLLSLTLGAVLGVMVAGFLGLFLLGKRSIARAILYAIGLVFLSMLVFRSVPALTEKSLVAGERVESRFRTYTAGIEVLRERPLFGTGSQSQVLDAVTSDVTASGEVVASVPHNAFIAIGVEKGIFGTLLLIALVVNALRNLSKKPAPIGGRSLRHYGILLGSVAFLIQNMSNLLVLHSRLALIWFAFLIVDIREGEFERAAEHDEEGASEDDAAAPVPALV